MSALQATGAEDKGDCMNTAKKNRTYRLAVLAAGVFAAAAIGGLFPNTDSSVKRGSNDTIETASVKAASSKAETAETEKLEFIEFRKAGIDEYGHTAAAEDTAKIEAVEVLPPDDDEPAVTVFEDFSVVIPGDGTQVYDPKPEKLNYTKTRSIRDEYFTVYDVRSGKTLTMNAYDILCRQVYSEIGANWNEEVIKAQAVASYSNLRFNDAIGVVPTVGLREGYPEKIEKCIKAVEGQCVYYNNGIANTVYCASTVGYTADCSKIWGVSYGYLKPVVSEYDYNDPNYGIETYFSEAEIRNTIQTKLGIYLSNDVRNWFSVSGMHSQKYVGTLSIDGGKATMSGEAARRLFGLRSSAFEISYSNGSFCFKTYGYGHGVGMSQWGAKAYGDNGYSYDQILRHYYVNTTVRVSPLSEKAAKRGGMSELELAAEIGESVVADADGSVLTDYNKIFIKESAKTETDDDEDESEAEEKPPVVVDHGREKPPEEIPEEDPDESEPEDSEPEQIVTTVPQIRPAESEPESSEDETEESSLPEEEIGESASEE